MLKSHVEPRLQCFVQQFFVVKGEISSSNWASGRTRRTRQQHCLKHAREPRSNILPLVSRSQENYPWARRLLERVPESAFISFLVGRPQRIDQSDWMNSFIAAILNFNFRNKWEQETSNRILFLGSQRCLKSYWQWLSTNPNTRFCSSGRLIL